MFDEEVLKGLKSGKPYEFVANNYLCMSKLQLKDIILEILIQFDGTIYENVVNELVENLIEYRGWKE